MWKKKPADAFFENLCASYYENVLRYLFRVLGEENAARDTAQEVFLTACEKKEQLMIHPNPGGWLFQAAKNLSKKAKRESFRRMAEDPLPLDGEGLSDSTGTVEWMLDKSIDETQYIDQVLALLAPEKRRLYSLHYMQGLTLRDIASQLGLEETAVRMRFVRLRREIREIAEQISEKNFVL